MEREAVGPRVTLRRVALLSALLHLAGLAGAWLWLRPGSGLVVDPERAAYLAGGPLGWRVGWGLWIGAAAAMWWLAARLVSADRGASGLARAGGFVVRVAAAADIAIDLLLAFHVPLAFAVEPVAAQRTQDGLSLLSLVLANGLYSLGVPLLTLGLAGAGLRSRRLALAAGLGGGLLAVAGPLWILRSDPHGLWTLAVQVATPVTMLCSAAWALSVARDLE